MLTDAKSPPDRNKTPDPFHPDKLLPGCGLPLALAGDGQVPIALARAVEGGHISSLGFLRPTGSKYCQTDSILQEAITRYKIEDTLFSTKMGIIIWTPGPIQD